jgi:hypothetical protein
MSSDKGQGATGRPGPGERGYKLGCGCCCGPWDDRCCCQMHADIPRGLLPKTCTLHERDTLLARVAAAEAREARLREALERIKAEAFEALVRPASEDTPRLLNISDAARAALAEGGGA